MNAMIYAVDFDGTLCRNAWPGIGEPNEALIRWLKREKEIGATLILWTMREGKGLEEAIAWCAERGLTFDAVNDNAPELQKEFRNNPRKVFADKYIDDHNLLWHPWESSAFDSAFPRTWTLIGEA